VWSPDGRRIAFVGGPSDEGFIDVLDLASGERRRLTSGGEEYTPAWLPDGRIAYADAGGRDEEIVVMNADGTGVRTLLSLPKSDEWSPDFSADGRVVVFVSDREDTPQVFVAPATGGAAARRLTGVRAVFAANGERCTIFGAAGNDVLRGSTGGDVICGLGGNDSIVGGGGNDYLDGGTGGDRLVGGAGVDELFGGAGDDVLLARDGNRERVDGGAGRDRATVDPGDWISFVERLF
jgi:Ca2+-binding RTX toxin-like protein